MARGLVGATFREPWIQWPDPYEPKGAIEKAFNVINLTPKGQEWYNIVSFDGDLY